RPELVDPLQAQGNRHQILLRRITLRDLLERNHGTAAQLILLDVRPVHGERHDLVGRIVAQIEVVRLREPRVTEQHHLAQARAPSRSAACKNAVILWTVEYRNRSAIATGRATSGLMRRCSWMTSKECP